ncbi:hypothetical protein [Loktanella sp. SALINAS62]|uniref:hypothetical protein n=1 Tax=Loktanella sp. SALINAS62 TaxID=2706124 RepID=UPI001B8B0C32|nr:hypothetical protein [Loktanella sp. SALINAS62]MBS1303851.1 hypothetical protein [Loktanella sp. SALINAS62]
MHRLADHADYRITYHPAPQPTEKLLVTFGGQPSDIADSGFGTDFAQKNGWDHVFVAQRRGTQFQGLHAAVFRAALSPLCTPGRDVICYGSSLGGYAALYYGGQIDARIIAAAPMLPAWDGLALPAYKDVRVLHRHLKRSRKSRHAPFVIYDPVQTRDVKFLNQTVRPAYRNVRELALPFTGHTVLVALSKMRLVKTLISGLIEDDRIPQFKLARNGNAAFHRERGKALAFSHPDFARREYERALELQPAKATLNNLFSLLIRIGDGPALQDLLDRCARDPDPKIKIMQSLHDRAIERGLIPSPYYALSA